MGSSISPSLFPQSIGSKYWYKVMMILLLCMVNESWCLDVCIRYKIHIPYRKRKKDRHWANTGGRGLLLGIYAFVQLLCKVVRLLIMMLENQDVQFWLPLTRYIHTTSTSKYYQGQTSSPPAVFLYNVHKYLSSSINVVRWIQKAARWLHFSSSLISWSLSELR